MPHPLILRRRELDRAVDNLRPGDLAILATLILAADPVTGRVAVAVEDLGARLCVGPAHMIRTLDRLARLAFLVPVAREDTALLLDVGPILRRPGVPPPNLPVDPIV